MEPINKNRWFFWAVVIAVLNPIVAGVILGAVMYSEPTLRKEGRIVLLFSIVWGIMSLLLLERYQGFLTL